MRKIFAYFFYLVYRRYDLSISQKKEMCAYINQSMKSNLLVKILLLLVLMATVANAQLLVFFRIDYFKQGNRLLEEGQYKQAGETFLLGLREQPNNTAMRFNYAFSLYKQGRFAQALVQSAKVRRIDPNFWNSYFLEGEILANTGFPQEARSLLLKGIKLGQRTDGFNYWIGFTYQIEGEEEVAKIYYQRAIDINPRNGGAYRNLGIILRNQGNITLAERYLKKAIQLNPNDDRAYNSLGVLYELEKDFRKAKQNYEKAIELNPNVAIYYNNLADVYRQQENYRDAEKYVLKAIELDDENPIYLTNYGNILLLSGNIILAEIMLLGAVDLDPKYAPPLFSLSVLYAAVGLFDEAARYLKKFQALN